MIKYAGKNLLHNLPGQFSGFHSFIFHLYSSKLLLFCHAVWHNFQKPKKVKVSVPFYTVLTLFVLNSFSFLTS